MEVHDAIPYNAALMSRENVTVSINMDGLEVISVSGKHVYPVLKADDGLWLTWPGYFATVFDYTDFSRVIKKNDKRDEAIAALRATFADAKAYASQTGQLPKNLKLEAMRGLFSGQQNLCVRADYAKDILEAAQFARDMGVQKVVIVGAEEADRVAGFLAEQKVPVILSALHRLPNRPDEGVDLPCRLPGILQKAGVLVSLSYAGEWWRTRNLSFQAGTAVGFGVTDSEEALKMITSNTARILGIADKVGTLEPGKHATLFVSAGDALDMRTNRVERVFIQGRTTNLDDRHKRIGNIRISMGNEQRVKNEERADVCCAYVSPASAYLFFTLHSTYGLYLPHRRMAAAHLRKLRH